MKTQKAIQMLAVLTLLTVALATIVPTVSARQDLRTTDHNLNTLNSFTYSGAWYNEGANSYLLKWYGGGQYFEPGWKAPATYKGIITATTMADYEGKWWGECVSIVKNLAHSTVVTDNWYSDRQVVGGSVSSGTAIATFVWNPEERRYTYSGHAAIFRQYTYDSYGRINGIIVWDQNWYKNENGEGIVAMHKISRGGPRISNADSYWTIQV